MKLRVIRIAAFLLVAGLVSYLAWMMELQPWDESRRGINALRMLQEGDFWNYRFLDQYDTFNTKPPLFTWMLAVTFKWFGVNLFTLRLISVGSLLALLVVFFNVLRGWAGESVAFFAVLVTIACNGLVGFHYAATSW